MGRFQWFIVVSAAVAAGFLLAVTQRDAGDLPEPVGDRDSAFESLVIGELVYEEFGDGRLRSLAVERVARRRLKIGPYAVNPLREIVAEGVRLVVRPPVAAASEPAPVLDAKPVVESLSKLGHSGETHATVRVRFDGLSVHVGEAGAWNVVVTAGRAEVDSKLNRWDLRKGVSIVTQGGQRLHSKRARWLDRGRRIEVHGDFEFFDRDQLTAESGAEFRLDVAAGSLSRIPRPDQDAGEPPAESRSLESDP